MTSTTQVRQHMGHSHSHHRVNTYLISTDKRDAGVRITRIGLFVNLSMAVGKGIGGYIFNSQALVADAFHALTDLVSDFMTLATVSWSLRPPTKRFPAGYGKIESLGSLGVSSLLLVGGSLMGLNACGALYHEVFADSALAGFILDGFSSHSHSHGVVDLGPNINAAWLAAGSVVVKEYLYRATKKIADERKSSVLASNAMHHRIDSLTSIVALAAIGGSHLFDNAIWLDPVGGLIVSILVIQAGLRNTRTALLELSDIGVDEDIKASVRSAASQALFQAPSPKEKQINDGTQVEIRDVQGIKAGQNFLIDLELAVPESWRLERIRKIESSTRDMISSTVRGVRRVKVRFVPLESTLLGFADEFTEVRLGPQGTVKPEIGREVKHAHEHEHEHKKNHENESKSLRNRR